MRSEQTQHARAVKTRALAKARPRAAVAAPRLNAPRSHAAARLSAPRANASAAVAYLALCFALIAGTFALSSCASGATSGSAGSQSGAQAASAQGQAANASKSEMIYGMLNANGSLRETYVVNRFTADSAGNVDDFGAYSQVANLSTTQELTSENGKVAFAIGSDPFFYQGVLNAAQLPWNIDISYALNGRTVSPQELAGSTGALDITIKTNANKQVNHVFYDSFMLQITFTLDGSLCSNVKAEGATLATSGKDITVAFTVLPGHDGSFKLSAQVKDFEMASAQIAALPYSSVVELPDTSEMESEIGELSSAITQLSNGAGELANGVTQLSSGASQLADGTGEFGDALAMVASSSTQIVGASSQINSILSQIAEALGQVDLSNIDDLVEYAPYLREAADLVESLKVVIQELDSDYMQTATILDNLADIAYANSLSDEEIASLREAVADNPEAAVALERLLNTYFALHSALEEYYASGGSPETIAAQIEVLCAEGGQIDQAVNALRSAADFLESGRIDQLKQLTAGLSDLSSGYDQFHTGLVAYTQGVSMLSDNYNGLSSGAAQLADGTAQLSDGANQLSDGLSQLDKATSQLPTIMRERMGELMADYDFPEFEPVSFVDERNTNVTAVQFVMMTDAIELPKAEAPESEPTPELTIIDRFLALFA